jgi:phage-related protein
MAQSVGAVALDIVAGKNTLNSTLKSSMSEAQNTVSSGSSGISKVLGGIGSVAGTVAKTVGAGMAVAGTAVVAMGKSAVSAYADYEQLVGGVETLFKDSAKTVIENASKAYTTAGMSANEYMSTVTSFSASLLQSLGNDTVKASEKADMAITDMSDNANKMGTSMEMIQNAYQGFAKQNYTMLDNLKLGYGGTKEEMQRLLADAEKISGIKYDISSYADIVDAIHVVQNEMGITGTTAKEASSTISGSLSSMKGAWQNLLTGMGDDTQDFGALVDQFVSSVDTVGANLLPRIEIVLGGVVKLVQGLAPKIIEKIPELVSQLLPSIITASVSLIQAIVAIIPDLVNAIVEQIPLFIQGIVQIVSALVQALPTIIQSLMEAFTSSGAELLGSLTTGLREKIPEFLENALPMLVDFTAELSNNIGLIVDAGLDLIVALCEGLIDSLPTLIENIPQIVINICSIINDNAPKIITTAIFLIGQLIVGLIKAIPTLVQNIPKIIEAIVSVITAFNWINLGGKIVSGIADGVKNLPAKLLEFVKNAISNIKNAFTNGGIGGVVSNVFNGIKNSISNILGGAWDFVKNTIKNIKDIFKFSWSLPNLKLPHFGVSPRGWKIGDLLKGSIPKLSIDWYAKAMNNPMIMTKPTIFGYDAGTGNLLGGGEAGSELVVGTNTLLSMIKSAVASVLGGTKMSIEVPALQNVRAGSAGSDSGLSDKMDRLIELFKQFIESGDSDMTVPIYIGNELIDEYILNKNNRNVLRSGGHA